MIFRIPTPVFGMGLVEEIDDTTLRNNIAANNSVKISLGIFGHFNLTGSANTNGNDGTITRFGWKAQNKSGLLFAGEAYNVEMGITNEIFQTEREENTACQFAPVPNDIQNTDSIDAGDAVRGGHRVHARDPALRELPALLGSADAGDLVHGRQRGGERRVDHPRQAEVQRRRLQPLPHAGPHDRPERARHSRSRTSP